MTPTHGTEYNPCRCYKTNLRNEQNDQCAVCKAGSLNLRRAKPFHGLFCWPCGQMVHRVHKLRLSTTELNRFLWRSYNASCKPEVTPTPGDPCESLP